MKRFLVLFALAGLFSPVCLAQKWVLEPGAVVVQRESSQPSSPALTVTGTFQLKRDDAKGIASSMIGGACLIADWSRPGAGQARCTEDKDCVAAQGQWGYCVHEGERPRDPAAEPSQSGGRCWFRPPENEDNAYCMRRITLEPGKIYQLPRGAACPEGIDCPITWRVHTCLNPPPPTPMPTGYKAPCATQERDGEATWNGRPKKVPQ